jgi:DNA-directed RNA polymerase subunit D
MHISVVKNEGSKIRLKIKDASVTMMNAIRRAVISDLQAYAIDEVDFYENNSAMFNEYIANRLCLIPLTYEESKAAELEVALSLNAEGPCMVYSRDLKSSDVAIKVFNENIPIIKLGVNQKLRLEAKIAMGTGKTHAKFQSAVASYSYDPEKKNPEFDFFVESFNNLTAQEQLMRVIGLIGEKAQELGKMKELK